MVIDYDSLSKSVASVTSESVRGSIGIGLYVVALGAVVAFVGGIRLHLRPPLVDEPTPHL